MTVKPLNLSILIGDMNHSPQTTPRTKLSLSPTKNNNNKKSRIPLATSPPANNLSVHNSRGVTTFRQWADPPPPPARSRTLERKSTFMKNHRPGSADPRFRRSLETSINSQQNDKITVNEHKKETSSSCELSPTLKNLNENPQMPTINTNSDIFQLLKHSNPSHLEHGNMEAADEKLINSNCIDDVTKYVKTFMFMESKAYPEFSDIDKNVNSEQYKILDNSKTQTKRDINKNEFSFSAVQSYSKYSQTDMSDFDANESFSREHIEYENSDIVEYDANNYNKSDKYVDSLVLNRTRSVSSLFGFKTSKIKSRKKITYGSISRIILKHRYTTYIEIWVAIILFGIILFCGWIYLLPYLTEAYYTWIRPEPRLSVTGYIIKSLKDIVCATGELIYGLLTAPAVRRLN